jgi:excisionase family DNA binding protein
VTKQNDYPMPRLVTLRKAAETLSVSIRQVQYWVQLGELPAVRLGPRMRRIDVRELERFVRSRAAGTAT